MLCTREIITWRPEDLVIPGRFFKRLTGSDPDDPRFADSIRAAREMVCACTEIRAVFCRTNIVSRDAGSVTVGDGIRFTGELPVRALCRADELYAFVVTLAGFDKVRSGDMLVSYYTDAWGSAFTECAQSALGDLISERAAAEGMIRTHMWCPGQHTFDLANQKPLFSLLHPEDIGCTLTQSLMMNPVKSSSGIIGIVPADTEDMPKPCDYCPFRKKCPSQDNGCSAM